MNDPVPLPRVEHGRSTVWMNKSSAGVAEMTKIEYALIERWNAAR